MTDYRQAVSSFLKALRLHEARLRLVSGLVLFAFAATHFLNHAAGLVSVDWMLRGQEWRLLVTRSPPGTAILVLALLIHFALGLRKIIGNRTWRMRPADMLQSGLGLLIPVFLLRHILGTRGVHELFGIKDNYEYALAVMWPYEAINQAVLMTAVWVHGCIGMHHALMLKPWYRKTLWMWYGFAILIPTLSFAGFVSAGREAALSGLSDSPLNAEQFGIIQRYFFLADRSYLVILAAGIGLWLTLLLAERYRRKVTISYMDGPTAFAQQGATLLEISRANRIPHASVCGGRARCSTCRVRIIEGLEAQPAALENETKVLKRVGAPANVRLACQLRPVANLRVATLLPAGADIHHATGSDKYHWGVEQTVTLLFSDLRGFTRLSEGRLSFDVVFLLNQFLSRMAEAIVDSGGYVDKFMGDGIMAIFGMDQPVKDGARQALAAARAMSGVLVSLNQSLKDELPDGLAIGIGIHTGTAILGRIGSADHIEAAHRITALGETVNTASRLESMTKELAVQLLVSKSTLDAAGIEDLGQLLPQAIAIRGLTQPIEALAAKHATDIPA